MMITVTLFQLILLISCGAIIGIIIYFLNSIKTFRDTVINRLIVPNEKHFSQIIMHVEEISSNADEISRILCGKSTYQLKESGLHRRRLSSDIREVKQAYRQVSGSVKKLRKAFGKLTR